MTRMTELVDEVVTTYVVQYVRAQPRQKAVATRDEQAAAHWLHEDADWFTFHEKRRLIIDIAGERHELETRKVQESVRYYVDAKVVELDSPEVQSAHPRIRSAFQGGMRPDHVILCTRNGRLEPIHRYAFELVQLAQPDLTPAG